MTEKSLKTPSTDQAKQWLEHDLHLLNEGATIDHLGHLSITGAQYDSLLSSPPSQVASTDIVTEGTRLGERATTAEIMTPERLKEIISMAFYGAAPYVTGRRMLYHSPLGKDHARGPARSIVEGLAQNAAAREVSRELEEMGVSEIVTTTPVSEFNFSFGVQADQYARLNESLAASTWQLGAEKGEPLYVVQYMTATTHSNAKYKYTDESGRPSDFNYALLLPQSKAKELEAAMQKNPVLARELGDMLVYDPAALADGAGYQAWLTEKWESKKPPYEEWRKTNGNVDRMAFRSSSAQPVSQATVVEY